MNDLLANLDKIHTTPMGEERIKQNLSLQNVDVISWCKNAIQNAELKMQLGKNWYAYYQGVAITINAKSFTIITAHKINGKVRIMQESDYPCLNEFLYQAIFVPAGEQLPGREIMNTPEIYIYIKDFGKQTGDLGVVAEQNGQVIGAAWVRIIPAYGHVDNNTPELAISIFPEFRGCGIGTKLMKKLFVLLQNNGYTQTSLSVQKENPALEFYKRLGYKTAGEKIDFANHDDYLMIKNL